MNLWKWQEIYKYSEHPIYILNSSWFQRRRQIFYPWPPQCYNVTVKYGRSAHVILRTEDVLLQFRNQDIYWYVLDWAVSVVSFIYNHGVDIKAPSPKTGVPPFTLIMVLTYGERAQYFKQMRYNRWTQSMIMYTPILARGSTSFDIPLSLSNKIQRCLARWKGWQVWPERTENFASIDYEGKVFTSATPYPVQPPISIADRLHGNAPEILM